MKTERLIFRLNQQEQQRIAAVAPRFGNNKSAVIRAALAAVDLQKLAPKQHNAGAPVKPSAGVAS